MIYLSGPMSNLPSFNYPAFEAAAAALRVQGHAVLSAHEVEQPDHEWLGCLKRDLIAMITSCHSIALLPGWETSKGARIELNLAIDLGFRVYCYIDGELVPRD